jgi:hypothetical protein
VTVPVGWTLPGVHVPPLGVNLRMTSRGWAVTPVLHMIGAVYVLAAPPQVAVLDVNISRVVVHVLPVAAPHVHAVQPRVSSKPEKSTCLTEYPIVGHTASPARMMQRPWR